MIERQPKVAACLKDNLATLGLSQVRLVQGDAMAWLAQEQGCFDVVFLDPPFADGLQARVLASLASSSLLAPNALIYLEEDSLSPPLALPQAFSYHRQKEAGQVRFGLLQWDASQAN
jgi:16S rRNA (guanine966-N2)-methyltransferase